MSVRERVLDTTAGYRALLRVINADRFMTTLVKDHIRPEKGQSILDIGCGEGALSSFLPDVRYLGVDHNESYIDKAKKQFGTPQHTFLSADLKDLAATASDRFDIITAVGVLHHLDDDLASDVIRTAAHLLTPTGRLVTVDPVFHPDQRLVTRLLMAADRGRYVRHPAHYLSLANGSFDTVSSTIRYGLLTFPYTHLMMEMTADPTASKAGPAT